MDSLIGGLVIAFFLSTLVALARSSLRAGDARQIERKHRRFFEESLAGAVVMDPDGRLLDANPAALAMLGLGSVAEFESRHFSTLFARPEQGREVLALIARSGRVDQMEMDMRRVDGRPLYVLGTLVGGMAESGRRDEIHGFLLDITEKRRVEAVLRESQKMEAIGRVAGGVAHDFNNLLSVITGYGELLERDLPPGHPAHRRLREIRRAADSATALTRQLLTVSRRGKSDDAPIERSTPDS